MKIQLSEHFTYQKLLRFTGPSIVMMVFSSIYGVVDGIFVSNFVGKTAFAAINLVWPYIMVFGTLGIMIGTGGTALVSMTLGEGKREKANQIFSMLVYLSVLGGLILSVIGTLLLRPVSILLGAEGAMLEDCLLYGSLTIPAVTTLILQNEFQCFCNAAERPSLGLGLTVAAGLTNIVLDALFVGVFQWGVAGAAIATSVSQCVGGGLPLIYFARENTSPLRLVKTRFDGRALIRTCSNGSSELMSNLSMSLVSMLYNIQLMRYAGENGVAAYGVIMYVNFIFIAVFLGYALGVAPVIGYHYGADNREELKGLLRKSFVILSVMAVTLTALALWMAPLLSGIFVSYDQELYEITCRAFMIYSLSFLLSGFNIFGSSFFTALNNGIISAAISFLRTLVFQTGAVLLLPLLFGLDGIWFSVLTAEVVAVALTAFCMIRFKDRYHYA